MMRYEAMAIREEKLGGMKLKHGLPLTIVKINISMWGSPNSKRTEPIRKQK